MSATTTDYNNETHVDPNDYSQGIVIFHENSPPTEKQFSKRRIKDWFFCYPDLEMFDEDRKVWRKGVAVQLQHGTVISWDARIIRHCTSMPHHGKDRKTHGTYFGLCGRVAKILQEKQKEKPTRFSSEKVSYSK